MEFGFFPFFLLLISFFIFIFNLGKQSKIHNLPPGPKKLPFIGSLHLFFTSIPPQKVLQNLSKKTRPPNAHPPRPSRERRRFLPQNRRTIPQDTRRRIRIAAVAPRLGDQLLQQHRHRFRPLRRLLAAAAQNLHARVVEHEAREIVQEDKRGGGFRALQMDPKE